MPTDLAQSDAIKIGFPWSKGFQFPADTLQAGDTLRMQFRQTNDSRQVLAEISSSSGIAVDGQRAVLSLTAEQTAPIPPGRVVTSFAITRAEVEYALDQLITIPVVKTPTRAE